MNQGLLNQGLTNEPSNPNLENHSTP